MKDMYAVYIFFFLFLGCAQDQKIPIKHFEKDQIDISEIKEKLNQDPNLKDSVFTVIVKLEKDSIKLDALFGISYDYYKQADSANFRFWNRKSLELSGALKDTLRIAEANWDLANFYYRNNRVDSAYFYYNKALELYRSKGDEFYSARMLINMAIIQSDIKDYQGSEVTTIQAIQLLKPLNKPYQLYLAFNNLGVVNNEMGEYERSLEFHQRALTYEEELDDPSLRASTYNNVGVVYNNLNEYNDAISYFNKGLIVDSLSEKSPELFAMLLDNKSYSQYLNKDTINVEFQFHRALLIRRKISHPAGIATSQIHLGEFYNNKGESDKALDALKEAKQVSLLHNLNGELMESYLLLAEVERNNASKHYVDYIQLSDSLQQEERSIRNKFARIRFETDEFIEKNELLGAQRKWMIFGFSGIVLFLISIFVIWNQRTKNRELKLIQAQQAANEDIYSLLIESQAKVEEGQEKEKKRISKELHDGILSEFFGVRLNLEALDNKTDAESVDKRGQYLQKLKQLENEIRQVSHELSTSFFSSEKSFINIIDELLEEQKTVGNFEGTIVVMEEIVWENLSPKVKMNFYRIIQEALHNVTKYADAKNVEISFDRIGNNIILDIIDDGIGFNSESSSDGIGLNNIRSRVSDLGGNISILSNEEGTKIHVIIPKK